jgi:probable HAF family extracellular repeat protein
MPREFNSLPRDPSLTGWSFSYAGFVSDPVDVDGAGPGEIYEIYVAGSGKQETPGEATFAGGIVWRIAGNSIAGGRGTIVGVTKLSGYDGGEWGEMNSRGQVTDGAETEAGSGVFQAFLWDGISGSGTRLGTLGGTNSFSNGINDYGTVVGSSSIVEGGSRGFVWSPAVPNGGSGTMVALSTLGGTRSWANGINNWNQIVGGAYLKGDRTRHACLWQNGAIQNLNSLKVAGATGLELLDAYRINNRGGIIGRFSTSKGYRACLLTPR